MSSRTMFRFRLYVAGETQNSACAIANLGTLCCKYLPDAHTVDIVDVFREPGRALADSILMTPTLMVLAPPPVRRIVGTLAQSRIVLHALGLEEAAE